MSRSKRKHGSRGGRPAKAEHGGEPRADGPHARPDDAGSATADRESLGVAAAELAIRLASFSLAAAETLDAIERRVQADLPSDAWRAPELVQAWDRMKQVNAELGAALRAGDPFAALASPGGLHA